MQVDITHISKYYLQLTQLKRERAELNQLSASGFDEDEQEMIKEFLDADIDDLNERLKKMLHPYVMTKRHRF